MYRSHVLMLIGKWLVIVFLAACFLLAVSPSLPAAPLDFVLLIGSAFLIFGGLLVTSFTHWRVNTDLITHDRLICVRLHGIFHYSVDSIPLRKVHSIDFRQEGLLQNLFGYGNIYIASELYNEAEKNIVLRNIARFEEPVEQLRQGSDNFFHQG